MAKALPARTDVAIIGGGVIGCSIAYHLTKIGITNVTLLERKQLTSGTTWHAAGLVGQLRATRNMTELAKYTSELMLGLEEETGQATGFKQNGSISIAKNDARMEEFKRGASMAKNFGLEIHVLSAGEIKERVAPIRARLDHYLLNEIEGLENPTSENIAVWIWRHLAPTLPELAAVTVRETCRNACTYRGPSE